MEYLGHCKMDRITQRTQRRLINVQDMPPLPPKRGEFHIRTKWPKQEAVII